jgi:(2S)-methylsuccinyl-CoA dehydrogenase
MTEPTPSTLAAASDAVELAQDLVDSACEAVRANGGVDANQVVAYDVAHAAAAVATARASLTYGALGETEALLATAFVADVLGDLVGRVAGREAAWGTAPGWSAPAADFLSARRHPAALAALANVEGPRHLGPDFELVRETFHRFAEDKVRPHAEHVHRSNGDIPEEIISGLAELGGFGLSVPEEYDGFATGGESDYMGMVVATEELSWGSLGIGGSLITRPEILTRALVYGGTEAQKKQWLPKLA